MIGRENDLNQSGIYRIDIGPFFYYGSAVLLKNRKRQHFSELSKGSHSNRKMQNAYNLQKSFVFSVVEIVPNGKIDKESILECEQYWIDSGFCDPLSLNNAPRAANTIGVKHSAESRANMSKSHMGLMVGMFHPLYGKPRSAETKKKLSEAIKGVPYSAERKKSHKKAMGKKSFREAISKAQKGRVHTPEHTEARMVHQRGKLNHKARSAWVDHPSFGRIEADTITELSTKSGIKRIDLVRWMNGTRNWPGSGPKKNGNYFNLNGIKGGYLK